jgi:hypothetical protein
VHTQEGNIEESLYLDLFVNLEVEASVYELREFVLVA